MIVGMKVTADTQTIAGMMIIAGMARVLAIALVFANAGRLGDFGESAIAVRRMSDRMPGRLGAFATPRRCFCNARSRLPAGKCLRMGDGFGPVGRVHFGMNHGYPGPSSRIAIYRNCGRKPTDDLGYGLRAAPLARAIATTARLAFLILS
jgi:hypothetical protein